MGNLSRNKREGLTEVDLNVSLAHGDVSMTGQEGASLAEDDENDLNVSFSHDDVSMTGQEGNSLAEADKNDLNVTLAHEDVSMTGQEGVDKNGSNLTPACEDDCV